MDIFLNTPLDQLVVHFQGAAHVKDCRTGEYLLTNRDNLNIFMLSREDDLIGKTVFDLDHFMRPNWKSEFFEKIVEADDAVKFRAEHRIIEKAAYLDRSNRVRVLKIAKHPVFSNADKQKAIGILTLNYELTQQTTLFQLFEYYNFLTNSKKVACRLFAESIGYAKYFKENLTCAETRFLLELRNTDCRKRLARRLDWSESTVKHTLEYVKDKTQKNSLEEPLECLRRARV